MAEKSTLLPPASTPVERKLAQVGADIEAVPLPIRSLRRAVTAPAALLPWLAWERSVDRWDDGWPEAAKRKALANSFRIHQIKGTIGALRRVVEPLGYLLEVTEWHQMAPEGTRGTFRLTIGVLDSGISEEMYYELGRLIEATKRLSQHLVGLAIAVEVRSPMNYGIASYDGDEMTVYPYQPQPVEVPAAVSAGLATHIIDILTVYP